MKERKNQSGSETLNQLMMRLNEEGGFLISVLTDHNGLPLAFASTAGTDPDMQSAVVAQVKKIANQIGRQLGMDGAEEVVLYDASGQRLICRLFDINEQDLILTVTSPDKEQSYRRVTNSAIAEIRRIWAKFI